MKPYNGLARIYCPVDISGELLQQAAARVGEHAPVVAALHCDFEQDQTFMDRILRSRVQRPLVLTLLGGTVGNLDLGETAFFAALRTLPYLSYFRLKERNLIFGIEL